MKILNRFLSTKRRTTAVSAFRSQIYYTIISFPRIKFIGTINFNTTQVFFKAMPFEISNLSLKKLALSMIVACILWSVIQCCEKSTANAELGSDQHPLLSSCITEMIRAICGVLRPSPIKRNTELINSILGLPRVLQEAGR